MPTNSPIKPQNLREKRKITVQLWVGEKKSALMLPCVAEMKEEKKWATLSCE